MYTNNETYEGLSPDVYFSSQNDVDAAIKKHRDGKSKIKGCSKDKKSCVKKNKNMVTC